MSASSSTHREPDLQRRWTVAEYMQLDEDHPRCEIIDGEMFIMAPAPARRHQRVVIALAARLWQHIEANKLGECHVAPFDIVLAEDTVVQPDVLFVAADRIAALDDGHGFTGAPDLVVEVLSPSTEQHDRTRKRDRYLRAAVPWLMLVDTLSRTAEVYHLVDGAYRLEAAAGGSDTLTFGLFPGLELALGELWLDPV